MSLVILNNETPKTCSTCGGECCKRAPGQYVPEDFGLVPGERVRRASVQMIREKLLDGSVVAHRVRRSNFFVTSSLFGKRPSLIFLRPATLGEERGLNHGLLNGKPCTNWSILSGCSLKFTERPFVCRALEAGPGGKGCTIPAEYLTAIEAEGINSRSSVDEVLIRWRPYQRLLKRLLQIVREADCKAEAAEKELLLLPEAPPKRLRAKGTPEGERYISLDN